MPATPFTAVSFVTVLDDHTTVDETIAAIASQAGLPGKIDAVAVNPHPAIAANRERLAAIDSADARRIGLKVLDVEKMGRGAARNIALEHCAGDLVIFLADDFVPGKTWLDTHLSLHRERPDKNVVGIGPGFFNEQQRRDPFVAWLEDTGIQFGVSFTAAIPPPPTFFYSANASLKRSFLDEAGAFESSFPFHSSDDWEMGLRLSENGMESVYLPAAAAWHHHRVGIPDRAAATRECGYSNAIHDRRHGGFSRPCYCNQSARVHCRRAWKWKARWLLSRDSRAREKYWINMLALAYLKGYSKGARQSS